MGYGFRGACLLVAAAICGVSAPSVSAQSFIEASFDPAVPTLSQSAGYAPGTRITSSDQAYAYLKALAAAAPDRARLVQYATSWEGRPLYYLVISSPQNMARLDAIKADLATMASGRPGNGTAMPVTWLAYGVHGNEISSTDAALMTAYHLLAARNDERAAKIMANTIVVIDPMQNPDGRAPSIVLRYADSESRGGEGAGGAVQGYADDGAEISASTAAARLGSTLLIGALLERKFLICDLAA